MQLTFGKWQTVKSKMGSTRMKIETNKQAVADRGWNHLARNLLDHPELKNSKNKNAIDEAYSQCLLTGMLPMEQENINLQEGASKTFSTR